MRTSASRPISSVTPAGGLNEAIAVNGLPAFVLQANCLTYVPLNPLLRAIFQNSWPGPGTLFAVIGQAGLVGLAGVLTGSMLIRNRVG